MRSGRNCPAINLRSITPSAAFKRYSQGRSASRSSPGLTPLRWRAQTGACFSRFPWTFPSFNRRADTMPTGPKGQRRPRRRELPMIESSTTTAAVESAGATPSATKATRRRRCGSGPSASRCAAAVRPGRRRSRRSTHAHRLPKAEWLRSVGRTDLSSCIHPAPQWRDARLELY
jgi:hypothetical protein